MGFIGEIVVVAAGRFIGELVVVVAGRFIGELVVLAAGRFFGVLVVGTEPSSNYADITQLKLMLSLEI